MITVFNEIELDEAMRASKLTRKQLGAELGIMQSTLRRYLADDNKQKRESRISISIKRCLSRHGIEMIYNMGGAK